MGSLELQSSNLSSNIAFPNSQVWIIVTSHVFTYHLLIIISNGGRFEASCDQIWDCQIAICYALYPLQLCIITHCIALIFWSYCSRIWMHWSLDYRSTICCTYKLLCLPACWDSSMPKHSRATAILQYIFDSSQEDFLNTPEVVL